MNVTSKSDGFDDTPKPPLPGSIKMRLDQNP
jgi:hypothetical protein